GEQSWWKNLYDTLVQPAIYKLNTIAASDPTKPIYTGHENIEEFLLYFEAYAASKDWDDRKKSLVIVLHIVDKLKPSMIQLIKVHSTWNNLKVAMITKWATSLDINEKLEHLKNTIQKTDDTAQMYTNYFDAYIDEVKDQLRDLKKREWYIQGLRSPYRERVAAAKELAVKMEKYDRDREYISKSPVKITTKKANRVGKEMVDESSTAQEAIKICRVGDQHSLNTERLDRMETSIVELLKAVQTLVERKQTLSPRRSSFTNLTLNRGSMSQNRNAISYMDQPNTNPNTQVKNLNIRGADVRLFEVIKKVKPKEDEYLMIYVSEDEVLFNVRTLGKRR
ncbi:29123_t:CDS:2, partial [Gigaspora margarita]